METQPAYIYIEETDSTSDFLARLIAGNPETSTYTVVRTSYQHAGRGQRGHSWESQRGKNLLFSILLRPQGISASDGFAIQQIVSLSIYKTLSQYASGFSIKWPNDIYWKDRKICGFITENTISGNNIETSIIGIGINLNQRAFISQAPNPVSLWQIINRESSEQEIMEQITENIIAGIKDYESGNRARIADEYMKALYRSRGFYPFSSRGREFTAMICTVTPQGKLLLCEEDGTITGYQFKEVSYII